MPDEGRKPDDIEKILHDERAVESRKKALVEELLKERAAALAAFDEKLTKLGYKANSSQPKRSHHKKAVAVAEGKPKTAKKPESDGPGKLASPTVPQRRR